MAFFEWLRDIASPFSTKVKPVGARGIGAFVPDPMGTYSNPATDDAAGLELDLLGALAVRSQVLTDEGGFRDHFGPGAVIDPKWTVVVGAGGSVAQAAGVVVIGSGVTPLSQTYISRVVDFLPMAGSMKSMLTARAAASIGADFFFGLYNTADPNVATEYVEWFFPGVGGNSNSECRTQSHAGAGGSDGIGTNVGCNNTTNDFFRQITLDGESAIFRDGQVTIPNTTVENTKSAQLPGLFTPLYFCVGFRNAAVVGAVPVTATVDTVYVKNLNRVVVNTVF